MRHMWFFAVVLLLTTTVTHVSAAVVNLDFNTDHDGNNDPYVDPTHIGADGILSTAGIYWNGIGETEAGPLNLSDEFGNPSPLQYNNNTLLGPYAGLDDAGVNDLQNAGNMSGGIFITGMTLGQAYDVAFYMGFNTGIFGGIIHDGVGDSAVTNATPTYVLPGVNDTDYVLMTIVAKDFGNGQIGFQIAEGSIDGTLLGLQIGDVPEPATLSLLVCGGLALIRRRR